MFWPSTQPSCLIDIQNGFDETDFARSCGLGTGPMPRIPTRAIFSDFCASTVSGARLMLKARTTASPISRMLPGSLAEGHDAHQRPGLDETPGRGPRAIRSRSPLDQ